MHAGDLNGVRGPLRQHRDVRCAAALRGRPRHRRVPRDVAAFFVWQARGASFEIVSLDVTAGDDVAYAHALLRCGTQQELADQPANRLRLTPRAAKRAGRWVVAHEHHSFPDTTAGDATPAPRPTA